MASNRHSFHNSRFAYTKTVVKNMDFTQATCCFHELEISHKNSGLCNVAKYNKLSVLKHCEERLFLGTEVLFSKSSFRHVNVNRFL